MTLFVYDHCPYCVKARMIFGYKNIDFHLKTLLNDDEETPIKMIGQKMVPILEKEPGSFMSESLDIVDYLNLQNNNIFLDSKIKEDESLKKWLQDSRDYLYPLAMPRWIQVGLEEFQTKSSIDYFTKKKEDYIGSFKEHLENSSELLKKACAHLKVLDSMLAPKQEFYSKKPSINDIHLYPTLRSLSVVKGIRYPENVFNYMKAQEEHSKVPLHLDRAI